MLFSSDIIPPQISHHTYLLRSYKNLVAACLPINFRHNLDLSSNTNSVATMSLLNNTSRSRTTFQNRPQQEQIYQYLSQQSKLANLNIANQTATTTPFHHDANAIDLDFDADRNCQSLSSSPISTQSLLSQYSGAPAAPLSAFDSIPAISVPRVTRDASLFGFSQSNSSDLGDPWLANTDLMQTEAWLLNVLPSPASPLTVTRRSPLMT